MILRRQDYFTYPAEVVDGCYVIPTAPGASTQLKADIALVKSNTKCYESATWLGD